MPKIIYIKTCISFLFVMCVFHFQDVQSQTEKFQISSYTSNGTEESAKGVKTAERLEIAKTEKKLTTMSTRNVGVLKISTVDDITTSKALEENKKGFEKKMRKWKMKTYVPPLKRQIMKSSLELTLRKFTEADLFQIYEPSTTVSTSPSQRRRPKATKYKPIINPMKTGFRFKSYVPVRSSIVEIKNRAYQR